MLRIIAPGIIKSGPEKELIDIYTQRLTKPLHIHALDTRKLTSKEAESEAILGKIAPTDYVILLDETGRDVTTPQLCDMLTKTYWAATFIIGGSYGAAPAVHKRANACIRFGAVTWPHKLVRAMLVEQIYRCQQIEARHPYHHA